MTKLYLSRLHFPITSLGPGKRIGIWFQGCSIRCAGCISRDTWESGSGATTVEAVLHTFKAWHTDADGLTVSGGEPFDQPAALEVMLTGWRCFSDKSVLVFTGYEFAKIEAWLEKRKGLIDALVAGPFQRDAGQTLALRGSDNQTLHILTDRGATLASYDRPLIRSDQHLDVMFDEDGDAWFAGIPHINLMSDLRHLLVKNGHHAVTSDQRAITEKPHCDTTNPLDAIED